MYVQSSLCSRCTDQWFYKPQVDLRQLSCVLHSRQLDFPPPTSLARDNAVFYRCPLTTAENSSILVGRCWGTYTSVSREATVPATNLSTFRVASRFLDLRFAKRQSDPQVFAVGFGVHPARRGRVGVHLAAADIAAVERGGRLASATRGAHHR